MTKRRRGVVVEDEEPPKRTKEVPQTPQPTKATKSTKTLGKRHRLVDLFDPKSFDQVSDGESSPAEKPKRLKRKSTKVVHEDDFEDDPIEDPNVEPLVVEDTDTDSDTDAEEDENPLCSDLKEFAIDISDAVDQLTESVITLDTNKVLDQKEVSSALQNTILKICSRTVKELLGTYKPDQEEWKKGLDPEHAEKLEEVYQATTKLNDSDEPTVAKLMELQIDTQVRADLLNKFYIYRTLDRYTPGWYIARKEMIDEINHHAKLDHPDESVAKLYQDMNDVKPSLDRIAQAHILQEDKRAALKVLMAWENAHDVREKQCYTEEFNRLVDQEERDDYQELLEQEQDLDTKAMMVKCTKVKILQLETTSANKAIILDIYRQSQSFEGVTTDTYLEKIQWYLRLPYSKVTPRPAMEFKTTVGTL